MHARSDKRNHSAQQAQHNQFLRHSAKVFFYETTQSKQANNEKNKQLNQGSTTKATSMTRHQRGHVTKQRKLQRRRFSTNNLLAQTRKKAHIT
jgi:hypothetical protein